MVWYNYLFRSRMVLHMSETCTVSSDFVRVRINISTSSSGTANGDLDFKCYVSSQLVKDSAVKPTSQLKRHETGRPIFFITKTGKLKVHTQKSALKQLKTVQSMTTIRKIWRLQRRMVIFFWFFTAFVLYEFSSQRRNFFWRVLLAPKGMGIHQATWNWSTFWKYEQV